MTGKVSALIGGQLLLGALAVVATISLSDEPIRPVPITFVVFTVAVVALMHLPPIYLELRRHASWITPTDGVYVVGLVALGPIGFVLAVGLAEFASGLRLAQSTLKRAFNLVEMIAGAAVGALVFTAVGGTDPLDLRTWVGAVLALTVIAAWDTIMTGSVLSIAEGEPFPAMLGDIAPGQAVSLAMSIPFGLAALVFYGWAWPSLLILVPILALLHLTTQAASRQRSERQRVQGLADSSALLVELIGTSDLLARIAGQSRALVTGASAIAIGISEDGPPTARLVDDDGEHTPDEATIAAVLEVVDAHDRSGRGETSPASIPREVRRALPACSSILWVANHTEDAHMLIVAVFRELLPDGGDAHRADVLATFVAHAATALANVQLHADLRRTLADEQSLHRRKDEFVATVSHELRTPLTSIGGAVETLRHRGDDLPSKDRKRLLDLALENAGRLQGLIEDLLLAAESGDRTVRPHPADVDLTRLLDGLERQFQPWLRGRLEVHLEPPDSFVPTIFTDGDMVRRILGHLLDNARKYAPDGPVELAARWRDDRLELSVSDHGPGIAPDQRDQVFDRFVQLDSSSTRAHGGLGLGLHLCRQLATSLGGSLHCDSPPVGGARFTLSIPHDAHAVR
jgi:signal transduction histidine kinase